MFHRGPILPLVNMPGINNNILQVPNDGLHCIWTASGIIDCCLCGYNYLCEECATDKILKNLFTEEGRLKSSCCDVSNTAFIEKIINILEHLTYNKKLIYLKNNLVLKHVFSNIFYLGFNPIFLGLLENITGIKESMKRVYFLREGTIMAFEGEWGSYSIKTPVNFLFLDKLYKTYNDIISNNRFALVLLNQEELTDGVLSCFVWNKIRLKILKQLNDFKECCSKINLIPGDKKESINSLYKLIGKSEYIKMLNLIPDE